MILVFPQFRGVSSFVLWFLMYALIIQLQPPPQHYVVQGRRLTITPSPPPKSNNNPPNHNNHTTTTTLQTQMCTDNSCSSNECQVYETPFTTCYNGNVLFPNDPSWSQWDILDNDDEEQQQHQYIPHTRIVKNFVPESYNDNNTTTVPPLPPPQHQHHHSLFPSQLQFPKQQFQRSFYATQDSSCQGEPTDVYILPLGECVGPFGKPRPWGKFSLVEEDEDDAHEIEAQ